MTDWKDVSERPARSGLYNVYDGSSVFSAYWAETLRGAEWQDWEGYTVDGILKWCHLPKAPTE